MNNIPEELPVLPDYVVLESLGSLHFFAPAQLNGTCLLRDNAVQRDRRRFLQLRWALQRLAESTN